MTDFFSTDTVRESVTNIRYVPVSTPASVSKYVSVSASTIVSTLASVVTPASVSTPATMLTPSQEIQNRTVQEMGRVMC